MRTVITDPVWTLLEPRPQPTGLHACGPKPRVPDRAFREALLHLARTGVPWRDLPGDFGAWDAVYNRFRRRVASGRLRELFENLTEHPELGGIPRLLVDSTILARPPARRRGPARKKRLGADAPAEARGLGRSRGGNTTRVPVAATDEDTAVEFEIVPGQRHDAPLLKPILKKALKRVPEIEEAVGDKGFDGRPQRQACADLGAMWQIPGKSNQAEPAEVYPEATGSGTRSSGRSRR